MKTMKTLKSTLLILACGMMLTACNKQAEKVQPKASTDANAANLKIAYVEVDSIMTRYDFALEYAGILKKKMETIQSTLNNKGIALQNEIADFQNKIQQGRITQEQATQMQAALQNKQTQLQNLQESLTNQYQKLQDEYNNALHDSIQNFLKGYVKTQGYDYILSKSGDNILYANPGMDITDDVIKGLNKRYKK